MALGGTGYLLPVFLYTMMLRIATEHKPDLRLVGLYAQSKDISHTNHQISEFRHNMLVFRTLAAMMAAMFRISR